MSELTKLRIIDKRDLAPYLEIWKTFEWDVLIGDDFGGGITGTYRPGPALIAAIQRLNAVFDLSAKERKEIEQLERTDPKRAQAKLNEWVRAKSDAYYGSLVEHFKSLVIPSIKEALNDLVSKTIDAMIAEFGGNVSTHKESNKKRGPKPLFVNKGECLAFITHAANLIKARGSHLSISAIAREIMTIKGRKVEDAYRQLKRYMDKFDVEWTAENGPVSRV